jgi:hypothetical protein
MREPPSFIDAASFVRLVDQCVRDSAPRVHKHLHSAIGDDGITALNGLLRPRLLQIQLDTRNDPYDWGSIYRRVEPAEPGPLDVTNLRRDQLETVAIGLLIMFTPLLLWWSTATAVPVGLEDVVLFAISMIETAEDPDCDERQLSELETHLTELATDAERIAAGNLNEVAYEIAELDDLVLARRVVDSAEDVAQLVFSLGSTALLDEIALRGHG